MLQWAVPDEAATTAFERPFDGRLERRLEGEGDPSLEPQEREPRGRRMGKLLDWDPVDRCRLLILLTIPFFAAYGLRSHYLLAHPNVEPYYDRGTLIWMRLGLGAACLFWGVFLAWGSRERRRPGSHTGYLLVGSLSWWLGVVAVAYALGPITTPAWIAIVIGCVTNLLLLPLRVAILATSAGLLLLLISLACVMAGLIPYGPALAETPIVASQLSLPYVLGNTVSSLVATLVVVGIIAYIMTEWRDALAGLQRANAQLDRDITERKRAQLEQEKLEAQMLQTQKLESLGVLAGGIAHDFRNLLVPILGNARLAKSELVPDSPVIPYVERIATAAVRTSELTDQLLAYAGRGTLTTRPLDVCELLREMGELLHTAVSRGIELRYELPDALPFIEGDATQLRQVILNLIINAAEAIGDRPGVVTIAAGTVAIDRAWARGTYLGPELPEGFYAYLEVRDDGCGMDEETRSKIFDPFFTTKFAGRGLGLAALLGIVRAHRGAVRVESEVGRGTRFRLLFPCVSGSTATVERAVACPLGWRGSGTVLVGDDEAAVREFLEHVLRRCGLQVILAEDGRQAVELFREHAPKIAAVLLDVTMPGIGGIEACVEMRKIRPDARIILSSGYSEAEVAARFETHAVDDFLQKPYEVEALIQKLRALLEA